MCVHGLTHMLHGRPFLGCTQLTGPLLCWVHISTLHACCTPALPAAPGDYDSRVRAGHPVFVVNMAMQQEQDVFFVYGSGQWAGMLGACCRNWAWSRFISRQHLPTLAPLRVVNSLASITALTVRNLVRSAFASFPTRLVRQQPLCQTPLPCAQFYHWTFPPSGPSWLRPKPATARCCARSGCACKGLAPGEVRRCKAVFVSLCTCGFFLLVRTAHAERGTWPRRVSLARLPLRTCRRGA